MNLQESGNGGHYRRTSLQNPPGSTQGHPGGGRHLLDMLPGLLDGAERVGGGPRASQQLLRDARLQVEACRVENELLKVSMACDPSMHVYVSASCWLSHRFLFAACLVIPYL